MSQRCQKLVELTMPVNEPAVSTFPSVSDQGVVSVTYHLATFFCLCVAKLWKRCEFAIAARIASTCFSSGSSWAPASGADCSGAPRWLERKDHVLSASRTPNYSGKRLMVGFSAGISEPTFGCMEIESSGKGSAYHRIDAKKSANPS